MKKDHYRSHLKNVRGLGTAHEGTHHFWVQRMTALALVPLTIWFIVNLVTKLLGADRYQVSQWLESPLTALLLMSFFVAIFWHAKLGLQVIIEDYVHCECAKLTLLIASSALNLLLCAGSVLAVAHLHFFGI